MPHKTAPRKRTKKRQTEFVGLQVWPTTRQIARDLARVRRQSLAVVVDDVLRAAYASAAIITADEGQPGYAHHGE